MPQYIYITLTFIALLFVYLSMTIVEDFINYNPNGNKYDNMKPLETISGLYNRIRGEPITYDFNKQEPDMSGSYKFIAKELDGYDHRSLNGLLTLMIGNLSFVDAFQNTPNEIKQIKFILASRLNLKFANKINLANKVREFLTNNERRSILSVFYNLLGQPKFTTQELNNSQSMESKLDSKLSEWISRQSANPMDAYMVNSRQLELTADDVKKYILSKDVHVMRIYVSHLSDADWQTKLGEITDENLHKEVEKLTKDLFHNYNFAILEEEFRNMMKNIKETDWITTEAGKITQRPYYQQKYYPPHDIPVRKPFPQHRLPVSNDPNNNENKATNTNNNDNAEFQKPINPNTQPNNLNTQSNNLNTQPNTQYNNPNNNKELEWNGVFSRVGSKIITTKTNETGVSAIDGILNPVTDANGKNINSETPYSQSNDLEMDVPIAKFPDVLDMHKCSDSNTCAPTRSTPRNEVLDVTSFQFPASSRTQPLNLNNPSGQTSAIRVDDSMLTDTASMLSNDKVYRFNEIKPTGNLDYTSDQKRHAGSCHVWTSNNIDDNFNRSDPSSPNNNNLEQPLIFQSDIKGVSNIFAPTIYVQRNDGGKISQIPYRYDTNNINSNGSVSSLDNLGNNLLGDNNLNELNELNGLNKLNDVNNVNNYNNFNSTFGTNNIRIPH